MNNKDDIIAIDLFCGAGGFSNGFENAGINIDIGVDLNEDALKTYEHNHTSETLNKDIRDGVPSRILNNDYDIVFGSPPCKGFSDARGSRYVKDDRNGLVFEYIHWVDKINPDIAVMENVTGIRTIGNDFIDGMKKEFKESGYDDIEIKELNSSDFGVPQSRKRVIVIATSKNSEYSPSFPPKTNDTRQKSKTTVKEAFSDLPDVAEDGIVSPNYQNSDLSTDYSQYVRDLDDGANLYNHRAKKISNNQDIPRKIIQRLEPGEMYRSNRFGDRYRQVWDVLSDEFTEIENKIMKYIANHRSKKDYRIKGKTVGHVDIELIKKELNFSPKKIEGCVNDLLENGWLRKDEANGKIGFDLNTKSGVRPRYMRLQPNSQSNTILTTDFKPRDKVHPFENRGLSLREGARIQSFPDSFEFKGSFQSIASQIGNAVPPLMAYRIGQNITRMI